MIFCFFYEELQTVAPIIKKLFSDAVSLKTLYSLLDKPGNSIKKPGINHRRGSKRELPGLIVQ